MGGLEILTQLRGMGLTLIVQGGSIRAEPKAALNDGARALIRTHKGELLAALREPQSRGETLVKSVTETSSGSSGNQYAHTRASLEAIKDDCTEFYEERAAIAEYDGGLSREDAETTAREATEQHRRECYERLQKRADAILSLPTWESRQKAIERHSQAHGEIAGQEMMSWVRFKSGLDGDVEFAKSK